eukprot:736173-Hanusia_phi.AAC.1
MYLSQPSFELSGQQRVAVLHRHGFCHALLKSQRDKRHDAEWGLVGQAPVTDFPLRLHERSFIASNCSSKETAGVSSVMSYLLGPKRGT